MKHRKYLLAMIVMAMFTGYSYAENDITNMIFDTKVSEIDSVIFSNTVYSANSQTKVTNSKTKEELDLFVDKAIEKARKEEDKKIQEQQKKKAEEEKKKLEEQRKKEEQAKQEELKKQEEKKQSEDKAKKQEVVFKESDMVSYAKSLLGIPYVWGGTSTRGFDCSGFVQAVYKKFDIALNRTTYDQIKQGKSVSLSDAREGDLVFFDTRASYQLVRTAKQSEVDDLLDIIINENDKNTKKLNPTEPTHVGMYIGDGKIIHASSSKRQTVIDSLDNGYFKDRIVDIRRYK